MIDLILIVGTFIFYIPVCFSYLLVFISSSPHGLCFPASFHAFHDLHISLSNVNFDFLGAEYFCIPVNTLDFFFLSGTQLS